jgi:hypothetical protein
MTAICCIYNGNKASKGLDYVPQICEAHSNTLLCLSLVCEVHSNTFTVFCLP